MKRRDRNTQHKCACAACGLDRVGVEMKMDAEELIAKLEPYFLYFMDPSKPAGQRFLGACIVEAHGFLGAIRRAHQLGINPGGQVICYDTPPHDASMRDRLIISGADMAALGFTRRKAQS